MDIWRGFIKKFPNIIKAEEEEAILYLEELDTLSLHYKDIIQEHKNSGLTIMKRLN